MWTECTSADPVLQEFVKDKQLVLILLFALSVLLFRSIVHTTSSCTNPGHCGMTECLICECMIDKVLMVGTQKQGG